MNVMAFGNWEMQAGDPTEFAFKLALLRNPHGEDDRATLEERESWGLSASRVGRHFHSRKSMSTRGWTLGQRGGEGIASGPPVKVGCFQTYIYAVTGTAWNSRPVLSHSWVYQMNMSFCPLIGGTA